MDTGLMHKGFIGLPAGEVLRLRVAEGRHIGVVRGVAWVTQDGDPRDIVLGAGESFRFDRKGLGLVMPLGGEAEFVLEEGVTPESEEPPHDHTAHEKDSAYLGRRARRLRDEAVADVFASLWRALKGLGGRSVRHLSAAIARRRTTRHLRGMSDRTLNDIGLRRDQINCINRSAPC